jgi:bacillithiol system protein YtxJ
VGRIFQRDGELLDDSDVAARFEPVETAPELAAYFAGLGEGPRLLFLHDPFCPISSIAYEEVEHVDAAVTLIDVSRHSALGREVQSRTGIRHESPQVIVFRAGVPVWHASHGRIRADAVREALAATQD